MSGVERGDGYIPPTAAKRAQPHNDAAERHRLGPWDSAASAGGQDRLDRERQGDINSREEIAR